MCFNIHPKHTTELIAQEDIKVKKYYHLGESHYESPWQNHKVEAGKLYTEPAYGEIKTDMFGYDIINKGFHSYDLEVNDRDSYYRSYHNSHPIECTIPKGTRYYYNPDDMEYVSEALLIGKPIVDESFTKINESTVIA